MVTKGYGFTVHDIDMSCPADLQPYADAYSLERRQQDNEMWLWFGSYGVSAVAVAVEHCLSGKKAKSKYIDRPVMEQHGIAGKEITDKDIRKAILTEEMYMVAAERKGLPETIIK